MTNDGATILKAIQLDNAAAKILVNISKVQDDEVGDGTTTVTVLAAELLREAEKLIGMKIHPQTIVEGYRIASAAALKALEDAAVDHGYVVVFALCDHVDLVMPSLLGRMLRRSDKTSSTSHGRHYRLRSCRRIKNTFRISPSMRSSG